ncbi:MAG: hypothetical protein DHS20C14_04840 [Phycisphaeraceae bacterium]|nr:MAG: hypothetical protein DHS20C14_04840 [Phycisphaeraceae bacterium]
MKPISRFKTTLLAALACGALITQPACNVIGPVFYAVHGPEKILPEYELDPNAATVILVDDPGSTVGVRRLRAEIASAATTVLLNKGLVTDMIEPRSALALASQPVDGKPLSITEIGQAVEADVVIYVLLTEFTLSADGASALQSASANVKVIDIREGRRVFPEDPTGASVRLRPEYRAADVANDPNRTVELEQQLANRFGLAIAQMFYKHESLDSAKR